MNHQNLSVDTSLAAAADAEVKAINAHNAGQWQDAQLFGEMRDDHFSMALKLDKPN